MRDFGYDVAREQLAVERVELAEMIFRPLCHAVSATEHLKYGQQVGFDVTCRLARCPVSPRHVG